MSCDVENKSSFVEVGEEAVICWETFWWINLGEEKSRKEIELEFAVCKCEENWGEFVWNLRFG